MGFQYVQRRGNYVCLDQNPLLSLVRAHRLFMRYVGLGNAIRVALHRWAARPLKKTLTLPVYGNACVRVQRGYMVFDLERSVATRVFRPRIAPQLFRAQHAAFRKAGRLSFAPTVRGVCDREQWFEMDYVDGESGFVLLAPNADVFLDTLSEKVLPCLLELSASHEWRKMDLPKYSRQLARRLEGTQLERWPNVQQRLRQFCERVRARLPAAGEVRLGYSHGDFVHPNLVLASRGLRVIDWECADWRSVTHDLYTFFFSQLFWRDGLAREALADAEAVFIAALGKRPVDLPTAVYRNLYYLERLAMVMGRDFGPAEAEHIDRSITLFEDFEASDSLARASG